MHLGQVISNPDLEGDYSPIDTTEKKWVRTRKKVGTVQIFFPCKPSILCFHEMDPDPLFFQNRKKKKKKESGPLLLLKALCKRIFVPYHLLYVSLP